MMESRAWRDGARVKMEIVRAESIFDGMEGQPCMRTLWTLSPDAARELGRQLLDASEAPCET